jgi:hypothetical protein
MAGARVSVSCKNSREREREKGCGSRVSEMVANIFIAPRSGGTHLSMAERWEVATEVLPSIQRLKTVVLLSGPRLSFISKVVCWNGLLPGLVLSFGLVGCGQVSPLPYFFLLNFLFYFLFQLSNLNSNLLAGF